MNELQRQLSDCGIKCDATSQPTATLVGYDLLIDLAVNPLERKQFSLLYLGYQSAALANCIAGSLWHDFHEFTVIQATSRQAFYECIKAGVNPISVVFPSLGNFGSFVADTGNYTASIVNGVRAFAHAIQYLPPACEYAKYLYETGRAQTLIIKSTPTGYAGGNDSGNVAAKA